jgi:hypothetical protein
LPTGYPQGGPVSDLVIPAVGLEDVDVAFFNLFDKEIPLVAGGEDGTDMRKVPVIFAGGEKWAMLKRNRPIRDKTNSLVLPLITVGRPSIGQSSADDITGRGINQRTGEITIRRKLDKSDRGYQNLINRIFLKHQQGLAVGPNDADLGQLTTLREIGELADDATVNDGGFLAADRTNNVYETLVIPSPQFVTLNYEVIVWTQYTHHMNQIIETLLSSFLPQTQGWRLDTPKGYWFVATVADDLYNAETNFEDMSQGERLIKYKFNVKVPAYILASSAPGVPIPVKRYISAPDIKFETGITVSEESGVAGVDDPFLGADDPTLPLADGEVRNRDQRRDGRGRLYRQSSEIDPNDPALSGLPRSRPTNRYKKVTVIDQNGRPATRYVRILSTTPSVGETVYSPSSDLGGLAIVVIDD